MSSEPGPAEKEKGPPPLPESQSEGPLAPQHQITTTPKNASDPETVSTTTVEVHVFNNEGPGNIPGVIVTAGGKRLPTPYDEEPLWSSPQETSKLSQQGFDVDIPPLVGPVMEEYFEQSGLGRKKGSSGPNTSNMTQRSLQSFGSAMEPSILHCDPIHDPTDPQTGSGSQSGSGTSSSGSDKTSEYSNLTPLGPVSPQPPGHPAALGEQSGAVLHTTASIEQMEKDMIKRYILMVQQAEKEWREDRKKKKEERRVKLAASGSKEDVEEEAPGGLSELPLPNFSGNAMSPQTETKEEQNGSKTET